MGRDRTHIQQPHRYRYGNLKDARQKYYTKIGKRDWIFATREGDANPLRLLLHSDFGSSSTEYVKVKGDKSPYDGNLVQQGRNN